MHSPMYFLLGTMLLAVSFLPERDIVNNIALVAGLLMYSIGLYAWAVYRKADKLFAYAGLIAGIGSSCWLLWLLYTIFAPL